MRLVFWFENVTSIDLGPIDTSEVIWLFGTFDRCFSLNELDVSMMNTSKVKSMDCAFYGDGKLTKLDLSSWDFSNVSNFDRMFRLCESLNLDCSDWNVQTNARHESFNSAAPA